MSEFHVPRTWQTGIVARLHCMGNLVGVVICSACLAGCATQQTITGSGPGTTHGVSAASKTISPRSTFTRSHRARTRFASHKPATDASIPLPGPALLERQPAPDCEFRGNPSGNAGEDARTRLDYQQQCYRQAEGIVRMRLDTLQDSVGETIRAVKGQ